MPVHYNGLVLARTNGFLGINWTKTQRHAAAIEKRERYKNAYLQCAAKQRNKGKTVVPDDPKGKCKRSWKKWQKWRGKAGERALALLEKAEKKGYLDPQLQAALQADMANAVGEQPPMLVEGDPVSEAAAAESLSLASPPWLVLGAVAATVTIGGILFLRRRR